MGIILTIIFILLSFVSGWLLTSLLGLRSKLEKVGCSLLLGFWLITLGMMVIYNLTGHFSREITLGLAIFLNLSLWLLLGKRGRQECQAEALYLFTDFSKIKNHFLKIWQQLNRFEKLLIWIVLGLLGLTGWSNLTWPVGDWDAIALYDFRAIVIKNVGNWADGKKLGYFYQYPPFTSLLHAALYLMGFDRVKIVYSLLFLSFLILFYALLRRYVNRTQAIIGMLLLSVAPLFASHITVAYTNLPYTIFLCAGAIYTWNWLNQKQSVDFKLALLFAAGASWIRSSEPFWLIILAIIIVGRLFIVKNMAWKTLLAWIIVYVGLVNYWPQYVNTLNLPPPPDVANVAGKLIDTLSPLTIVQHLFTVTRHFYIYAVKPVWLLLVPVFIITFWDRKFRDTITFRAAFITIFLMLGSVYAGTYYFSFYYKSWDAIGDSLTRLMMFVVPLLIYLVCLSSFWQVIFKYLTFSPTPERKQKPR